MKWLSVAVAGELDHESMAQGAAFQVLVNPRKGFAGQHAADQLL
jgi:hypothetical protein